ncbi:hypothetical protein ROZALSC1DRAFT_29311, partial [Rozella allomycis CSF55]
MDAASRTARFDVQLTENRFEELRAVKRKDFDEKSLRDPTYTLVGTCLDKCPEYERHEREIHLDLSSFEMIPGTETHNQSGDYPRIDHFKAVKKYHRPAAGNEQPLPEDVRPSKVLLETMDYLVKDVLDRKDISFSAVHNFIRDRTRSIRQDFTLQNIRDDCCVRIHERIARFHIVSGYLLCEEDPAEFDAFQNTEQLRKVLQSLHEFYTDAAKTAGRDNLTFENEPEFRCYYILTHLKDTEVFRKSLSFHPLVFKHPLVQFALRCCLAFHCSNYVEFFRLFQTAPFLASCLLHSHLKDIRLSAYNIMSRAYLGSEAIPEKFIMETLCFEDRLDLEMFCEFVGAKLENGVLFFNRDGEIENDKYKNRRSFLIDSKNSLPLSDVVNGNSNNELVDYVPLVKETKVVEMKDIDMVDFSEDSQPNQVMPLKPLRQIQPKDEFDIDGFSTHILHELVDDFFNNFYINLVSKVYNDEISKFKKAALDYTCVDLYKQIENETVCQSLKSIIQNQINVSKKKEFVDAFSIESARNFLNQEITSYTASCILVMLSEEFMAKTYEGKFLTNWISLYKTKRKQRIEREKRQQRETHIKDQVRVISQSSLPRHFVANDNRFFTPKKASKIETEPLPEVNRNTQVNQKSEPNFESFVSPTKSSKRRKKED